MKLLPVLLLLISSCLFAQKRTVNFSSIDRKVKNISAPTPDSLARLLTSPYQTELEKTRAIFSWIAQHISYNTGYFNSGKKYAAKNFVPDPYDTASFWKPATELTAEKVLRRGIAVCDGYAKLFKTLCDHAGLQSEIILGFAKCYTVPGEKFRTNHTWNAVKIDSNWYLLDVTWASGYVNYANEFVHDLDEAYFLPSPQQFIFDHYPEDLRWTLLEYPPTLKEFRHSPFRYKSFIKYSIHSFIPSGGMIEASIGDTVSLELNIADLMRDFSIGSDPFFDSTALTLTPASVFLKPSRVSNTVVYTYVVKTGSVEWLHLLYNNDPVLRYRLNIRKEKPGN